MKLGCVSLGFSTYRTRGSLGKEVMTSAALLSSQPLQKPEAGSVPPRSIAREKHRAQSQLLRFPSLTAGTPPPSTSALTQAPPSEPRKQTRGQGLRQALEDLLG